MWCAGRNGRKERKHDNACGGASGLGKANPKSCEGKGTEEMLSSKRRGFGHVWPWNYRLFYFVNSFFWVPFLAFAGFCFCCFLLFQRCSLCCFCRAECFFLVRLSLLLFFLSLHLALLWTLLVLHSTLRSSSAREGGDLLRLGWRRCSLPSNPFQL